MAEAFDALLRRLRLAAGITQEELAERAGLSGQAVGALERGDRRRPYPDTINRLAAALELPDSQRRSFEAAARHRRPVRPTSLWPEPRQLPIAPPEFSGRTEQVRLLTEQLDTPEAAAAVAISGMAGVGKTALALHVAHALAAEYPDGQLHVDLRGDGASRALAPADVLRRFIRDLGGDADALGDDTETVAAHFRSVIAGRRLLVVLDNAAEDQQVLPLLPAGPGCAAIVTSRRTLAMLPAGQVRLDVMAEEPALILLANLVGSDRIAAEPKAALAVVRLCGGLPLALRIAAARVAARPRWQLADFAALLADEQRTLDELAVEHVDVRTSLCGSIEQLGTMPDGDELAAAFALLGVPDGPRVSVPVAARLLDRPIRDTERLLGRLTDLHLVESPSPGTFELHDLIRVYAREYATVRHSDQVRDEALGRVADLYNAVAWRSSELFDPAMPRLAWFDPPPDPGLPLRDSGEALRWLESERAGLTAILTQANPLPARVRAVVPQITLGLCTFFLTRGQIPDWIVAIRTSLDSTDEPRTVGTLRHDLGLALARQRRSDSALAELGHSDDLFRQLGDTGGEAMVARSISLVLERAGRYPEAITQAERSLALFEQLGWIPGQARTLISLGLLHYLSGAEQRGYEYFRRSLTMAEEAGNEKAQASALRNVGCMHEKLGDVDRAVADLDQSIEIYHRLGDRTGELDTLGDLVGVLTRTGALDDAAERGWQAVQIAVDLGDSFRERTARHRLAETLRGRTQPG